MFGVNICMYELYVYMQIVPFMKEILRGLVLLDVVMHFGIALPGFRVYSLAYGLVMFAT